MEVGDLYDLLEHSKHGAYPVVEYTQDGVRAPLLKGMILRTQLVMILKFKV